METLQFVAEITRIKMLNKIKKLIDANSLKFEYGTTSYDSFDYYYDGKTIKNKRIEVPKPGSFFSFYPVGLINLDKGVYIIKFYIYNPRDDEDSIMPIYGIWLGAYRKKEDKYDKLFEEELLPIKLDQKFSNANDLDLKIHCFLKQWHELMGESLTDFSSEIYSIFDLPLPKKYRSCPPIIYRGLGTGFADIDPTEPLHLDSERYLASWTPNKEIAIDYAVHQSGSGVIIKKVPKPKDMLINISEFYKKAFGKTVKKDKYASPTEFFVSHQNEIIMFETDEDEVVEPENIEVVDDKIRAIL